MDVIRESLASLARSQVAFCEQLAWFALESAERAHRLNMDAFEAFWERRIGELKAAAGMAPPVPAHRASTAFFDHWARVSEAIASLGKEFERLITDYATEVRRAVPHVPAAAARKAATRGTGRRRRAQGATTG